MKNIELLKSQTSSIIADCIISAGAIQIGANHHLVMATKIESFLGLPAGTADHSEGYMFYLVELSDNFPPIPRAIDEENIEHLQMIIDAYDPEHYVAKADTDAANRSIQTECPFDVIDGDTLIMQHDPKVEMDMFVESCYAMAGLR